MLSNIRKSTLIMAFSSAILLSGCASQSQQNEISELRAQLRVAERAAADAENCKRRADRLEQRAEAAESRADELQMRASQLEQRMQRMESRISGGKN
ncbi:hypothetical protein ACR0ST_13180 [Aliidiomarina sp. Khilg15.8]